MTEIAHYQHPNGVAVQPNGLPVPAWGTQPVPIAPPSTVQNLQDWAQAATAAHSVALSLAKTSFVPAQFKDKPDECTAAILAGDEVGLSPLASLRSFDIIQGTAAARAMTLRAIVQSKGHDIWEVESTDQRAIVKGRRKGSGVVHTSTWDMSRARGLGLHTKDNWRKQPKAMLVARATAECCRLVAADAILGIPYAVEELDDGSESAAPAKRTAQRRQATAARVPQTAAAPPEPRPATPEPSAADGPPLPGEDGCDEPAAEPEQAEEPAEEITAAQQKKIGALMREHGITERDVALGFVTDVIGREIGSRKELTKVEASQVIDALENQDDEAALLAAHEAEQQAADEAAEGGA